MIQGLSTATDDQGVIQVLGLDGLEGLLPGGPVSVSRRAELSAVQVGGDNGTLNSGSSAYREVPGPRLH